MAGMLYLYSHLQPKRLNPLTPVGRQRALCTIVQRAHLFYIRTGGPLDIAILLDGDFTRRLVKRKVGRNPMPNDIEAFCRQSLEVGEIIYKVYFYDCPPYSFSKQLPISKKMKDFQKDIVFRLATGFQKSLAGSKFFVFRKGHLSFDGWAIKESSVKDLIKIPRPLIDGDFYPVLTQKQVDMKIGFDVAKLSYAKSVKRILLATSDSDFIPAIHFARNQGLEVVLLSDIDAIRKTKKRLINSCSDHRIK